MMPKILLTLSCGFLILGCADETRLSALRPARLDELRRDRAIRGLDSKNWLIRRRAIQELARGADTDSKIRAVLMKELFALKRDPATRDIVEALARGGARVIPEIIREFSKHKANPEKVMLTLCVIGAAGEGRKDAIPFLAKQLKVYESDPDTQGQCRILLANLGFQDERNMEIISANIAGRTEQGKAMVGTLGWVAPGNWITDDIVRQLVKWLDKPDHDSDLAASALAMMGEKGKGGIPALKHLIETAEKDESLSSYRIGYGVALARIDKKQRHKALRRVMEYAGSDEAGSRTDTFAMLQAAKMMDPDMIQEVTNLLHEKDVQVAGGAVQMLWAIGLPAEKATPRLMKILTSSNNEDLREEAATALGAMAPPSVVPRLTEALAKQKSWSVREELKDAVETILLGEHDNPPAKAKTTAPAEQ